MKKNSGVKHAENKEMNGHGSEWGLVKQTEGLDKSKGEAELERQVREEAEQGKNSRGKAATSREEEDRQTRSSGSSNGKAATHKEEEDKQSRMAECGCKYF